MVYLNNAMRLLLFDIDGTLLRLRGGIGRRIFVDAFQSTLNVDVSTILNDMSFAGRTDRNLVAEIAQRSNVSAEASEAVWPEIQSIMEERAQNWIVPDAVEVMPGAHDLLDALSKQPVSLGLVTGNVRSIAFKKLEAAGLAGYFLEGAFGCEHPDRNELPPRALIRLNALHGTAYSASDAVIIGDAPQDVECARAHGIRCVGVATGQFTSHELEACGAHAVLESFRDLPLSQSTILA